MSDTAQMRARLDDTWPSGEGVECVADRCGGAPVLVGTRWPVIIWWQFLESYGTPDATDAAVLAAYDWLTPEQVATARAYCLGNQLPFIARREFNHHSAVVIDLYRADVAYLLQALADAETRAARDAARLADHLALLNLEEAVRCMMTHHNWRECAKVPNALANLDRQRAATPRPDAGLCAVCGGTRTVRSRYTLLGGQVIEQDEPCGDCAPRPDAGQGVG